MDVLFNEIIGPTVMFVSTIKMLNFNVLYKKDCNFRSSQKSEKLVYESGN